MNNERYGSNLAFVDLLFNLILGFVFLFVISFLLINDPKKEENIRPMSEYMVILNWDEKKNVDLDLWLQGPSGVTGFQSPVKGYVYLDKDDLGHRNDSVYGMSGEREILYINREIMNIRGIQEGEYIVNVHYYGGAEHYYPVNYTTQVVKLNPFSVIHESAGYLKKRGEEQTVVRFNLDKEGNLLSKNFLPISIIYSHLSTPHPASPNGP